MPSLAATATPLAATHRDQAMSIAWLALIVIGLTAGYLLVCWIWPFGSCGRCKGTGKRHALIGRGFRHCGRCDGSGYRIRIGRHVVNYLRATHRAGTKNNRR